jgi:hypothetical protein
MFRAANRSSSGALTLFAASGLYTHVVTGRSQVWVFYYKYHFRNAATNPVICAYAVLLLLIVGKKNFFSVNCKKMFSSKVD